MTVRLEKKRNKYAFVGRVVKRNPCFSKNTDRQHSLSLESSNWTNYKTSGTNFFAQVRPEWRYLAIIHSAEFGETQTNPP